LEKAIVYTMGRIKTTLIKRKTQELKALHGDNFTTDFSENKKLTNRYAKVECKKLRNIIAGYMTRLKRKEI
jgi:small subunit ribosomal protein S17e